MKKITNKQILVNTEKKILREKMKIIFMEIWRERKHKSEISGKFLGKEPLTIFFHHILPKSKYKNLSLNKDNIILLTFEEHQRVEIDPFIYEEINKRRNKLIEYDRNYR